MPAGRRSVVAALVALAAAGSVGCGDEQADRSGTTRSAATTSTRTAPPPSDLALPARVPRRATGPADRAAVRVIRRWLAALTRGDIRRAAHFFALPSKFQNFGTPVLTIDSEIERIAVNRSLTCGARAIRTGGAGPYTIVRFRLTDRPGGECGDGAGETARGAIRVAGGRIREWYRLPDDPDGQAPVPPAPSGPVA